jgi:hypothetical protein
MKNKLMDLNNILFAQLEQLSDIDIVGDDLKQEVDRSKAMCHVAAHIVDNARVSLKAHTLLNRGHMNSAPKMIGLDADE